MTTDDTAPVAILLSGGLDSCILLAELAQRGRRVCPIYVRFGFVWEEAELAALTAFMTAASLQWTEPITVLQQPVGDLLAGHWALTGRGAPNSSTPDEAVFLPGRNALLLAKSVLWCQLQGIREIALGHLATNPFDDATDDFLKRFLSAMNLGATTAVRVSRPFETLDKRAVIARGVHLPLELTFSCLAPLDGKHCGCCNKCAERQAAFRDCGLIDPTHYAGGPEIDVAAAIKETIREGISDVSCHA